MTVLDWHAHCQPCYTFSVFAIPRTCNHQRSELRNTSLASPMHARADMPKMAKFSLVEVLFNPVDLSAQKLAETQLI